MPRAESTDIYLKRPLNDKLIEYKEYITKEGRDLPEIHSWRWRSTQ
jgi:phosphoketolase